MPGHLDDPFDPTDRCWYKKDNQPRTIKSNISSPSSSSGAASFASPNSSRVISSKSPSGTRSTSRTRHPGATSPFAAPDPEQHAFRGHRRNQRHDTRQGSSARPLADASNALTARVDPDEGRRKMHMLSPQQGAGTPPNTVRRARKSRDHKPTSPRRSSSTPAGGNPHPHTKKDAMRAWHPTPPVPPGKSWYIPRQDASYPSKNSKPTRHRRASSGSATLPDTRPLLQKRTGVMRGWYTAVCRRFGVVGAD
ncbi:hypothetical protein M413DRAFT_449681 [Hebeloma cylindrosporum]|uniref:Uncharacterized protein n=1 Tax=Hebeloma cylindrosporum TaxID=76867 RepID=A0A0C2Y363_HEBCY|nr:hypothetical protein M413DRAFT_449681 [Hebeloma cylindrosporum h7]